MRITCTLPDFPECWVEVSEKWTRGEERELVTANADTFMALWQRKIVACNLRTEAGEYITQPPAVTWEAIDGMDVRLAAFVGACMGTACLELRNLGKVSRRVSFNGSAPANAG
jgi:hypothetical protein